MVKQMDTISCPNCRVTWHLYHPLDEEVVCDDCGAVLWKPKDKPKEKIGIHTYNGPKDEAA